MLATLGPSARCSRAPCVTKDDLVPFANVAYIKSHMTGVKGMDVTVIEGQNHFLPWNAKAQVRAAIAKVFKMTAEPGAAQ